MSFRASLDLERASQAIQDAEIVDHMDHLMTHPLEPQSRRSQHGCKCIYIREAYMEANDEDFKFFFGVNRAEYGYIEGNCSDCFMPSRRGRRAKLTPRDSLLWSLRWLRSGINMKELAKLSYVSYVTFHRAIWQALVIMEEQIVPKLLFKPPIDELPVALHFPDAKLVVDGTIQQFTCGATLQFKDRQTFFSHKHKAYGIKSEVI
ncbi:hypothetical protein ADUPG1_006811, partial [Aduncisulcus paluster]